MQRILEPGQIESFAQRSIPRLRRPDRAQLFSTRAARLRQQGGSGAVGRAIGDYLHLMAHVADAQQAVLAGLAADAPTLHGALTSICDSLLALSSMVAPVRAACDRLRALEPAALDTQATTLLAARAAAVDAAAAPFLMAALQVVWVDLASRSGVDDTHELDTSGVCPTCGTLPVASIVRADARSQGFRYLHCGLCATEWHMVRVKCSHCQATQGISYQSIENGPPGIRAECCDTCRTYRKILYQEEDSGVEPVADDLASVALDLLLSEAGYHRASANPLLWSR
jgi:FdhE protein